MMISDWLKIMLNQKSLGMVSHHDEPHELPHLPGPVPSSSHNAGAVHLGDSVKK